MVIVLCVISHLLQVRQIYSLNKSLWLRGLGSKVVPRIMPFEVRGAIFRLNIDATGVCEFGRLMEHLNGSPSLPNSES